MHLMLIDQTLKGGYDPEKDEWYGSKIIIKYELKKNNINKLKKIKCLQQQ